MIRLLKTFNIIFICVFFVNNTFLLVTEGIEYFLNGDGGYSNTFHLSVIVIFNVISAILIALGLYMTNKHNIYLYIATAIIITIINIIKSKYIIYIFSPYSGLDFLLISSFGSFIVFYSLFYVNKWVSCPK